MVVVVHLFVVVSARCVVGVRRIVAVDVFSVV